MKIGYQGDIFSNNYYATIEFAKKMNLDVFEAVPLINSYPVLSSLKNGEIDYGIVAFKNALTGSVSETLKAFETLGTDAFSEVMELILPINHSLFVLPKENADEIECICSHEQVLKQCGDYLCANHPNISLKEEKDSALAALYLSENKYSPRTAVICRKECGEHYGLKLVAKDIGPVNNETTFKIYKRNYPLSSHSN